jgi:hypothetical protein
MEGGLHGTFTIYKRIDVSTTSEDSTVAIFLGFSWLIPSFLE